MNLLNEFEKKDKTHDNVEYNINPPPDLDEVNKFHNILILLITVVPGHAKMCLMTYANNKGADQPAHPRSLISTFIVRCFDSMTCILALSKVLRL